MICAVDTKTVCAVCCGTLRRKSSQAPGNLLRWKKPGWGEMEMEMEM